MGVFISDNDLNTFKENGITEEQIKDTISQYRAEGVSDDEIRIKIDNKLKSFSPEEQSQPISYQEGQPLEGGVNKNYTQNWDKKGRVYYTDENGNKVDFDVNPLTKLGNKAKAIKTNIQNWIEESNPNSKSYQQKANAILSIETLPMGLGRAATQTIATKFAPYMGKKIGQEVAQGIGSGLVGGGVYGGGNALIEDENIPLGILNGAAFGSVLGGGLGLGIGYLGKFFAGKNLKNLPIGTRAERKIVKRNGKKYYKDYIQGTNTYRNDLGKVKFDSMGVRETATQQPKNMINYKDLKNNIKNAEYIGEESKIHQANGIEKIHRLRNNGEDYLIAETPNGQKYYLSKDSVKNGSIQSPTAEAKGTLNATDNIINDNVQNFNPIVNFYNDNSAKIAQRDIKNSINELKVDELKKETVKLSKQGNFWSRNIDDPVTRSINNANDELNKIIQEIKVNPKGFNSDKLEQRLIDKVKQLPEDLQEDYYNRFYEAINRANEFNKVQEELEIANSMRKAGELKQSQLATARGIPREIRSQLRKIPPEYQVLHNADLEAQANELVNINPDELQSNLLTRISNKDDNFSALDFEAARQLVEKFYQEGRIEEALNLTSEIARKGSKAGQAVQAMSLWAKTTPAGAVKYANKIIDEYNQTARKQIGQLTEEQAKEIVKLTENIQGAAEGREKDVAVAMLMKKFRDLVPVNMGNKLKSLRNISLLLNPKTIGRNVVGNAIFSGVENLASKPLAVGIDRLAGLFTGKKTRVLPRLGQYGRGFAKGTREGIQDVNLGIDTRNGIGGRFDMPEGRSFNDPILGNLEKGLDYSLRVPDRAFYQATFEESLANQMKAANLTEPTQEMIEIANQEALESVYQNKSMLGESILKGREALNKIGIKGFGAGDVLIPYAQTPANLVQQGINYSPLGLIKSTANFAQGNQRQAALDAARALLGSGIIYGGYQGAKNGLINNNIDDYQVRKNYEAMGIRPNTFNMGNDNISYSQLQPISVPLAAGVALGDMQEGNYIQPLNNALGTITDLSMLQGLNNFAKDYNNSGLGTAITNFGTGIPSQFVPTALNQINAFADPYQRETYDPNIVKQAFNKAISKVPLASNMLPKKYDVIGEPINKYQSSGLEKAYDVFVNPVFKNTRRNDNTLNELTRLYEMTGDKTVLLPIADKNIKFTDIKGNKVNRKLSGEDYSKYQQQIGAVNKQALDQFINTDFYKNLDDDYKADEINKIQRKVKEKVDEELFGKPSAAKLRLVRTLLNDERDKIIREILSTYNREILPMQIENIYNQNNFE